MLDIMERFSGFGEHFVFNYIPQHGIGNYVTGCLWGCEFRENDQQNCL